MTTHPGTTDSGTKALEKQLRVLVIDDEERIRKVLSRLLERDGHHVTAIDTANKTRSAIQNDFFHVAFLDLRLRRESGLELVPALLRHNPSLKIIVITAHATIDTAVQAIKRGAADYLPKPFSPEQVRLALKKAVDLHALQNRVDLIESDPQRQSPERLLESNSPAMQSLIEEAKLIADSDASVLLLGESGTGKGVLARAIHGWSRRAGKPFGVVHGPSLSRELFESELFGHVQGAFTGATRPSPGRISQSDGGTLFLDEVADLPIELQPKLLRFVQSQQYERVGDPETQRADVRLITATNQDLEQAVEAGSFREDLFYRLNVMPIEVPPLRERSEDILTFARRFMHFYASKYNRPANRLADDVKSTLKRHRWPGNVRELENAIERAVILCRGSTIELQHLPFADGVAPSMRSSLSAQVGDLVSLEAIESAHIEQVLRQTETLEEAAQVLGVDTSTLWRRRKKYGL